MKFPTYKKDLDISYTLGFYPTIELLKFKPRSVKCVIYSSKAKNSTGFEQLMSFCKKNLVPFIEDEKNVDKLSNKDNTYVVGIFEKFVTNLDSTADHLLLFSPKDIGNLGMIFRSAVGFNRNNIAIISDSVDSFNPKVIRASVGAFFQCNVEYFNTFGEYVSRFNHTIYSLDIRANKFLNEVSFESPNSIIFGTEGEGLPDDILLKTNTVLIPFESNKIDSLNLANSVSIVLYHLYLKN